MTSANAGARTSSIGRSMWTVASGALMLALGSVVVAAGPSAAQEERSDRDTARAERDDAPTEYRREVFEYPSGGRRNPFEPVNAGVEEGPRFQNLRVTGVLHSPAVGSVAILVDETTGERYRVRDGQTIGEARVLEIRRTEVAFAVSGAGETRRETLRVEREDEG